MNNNIINTKKAPQPIGPYEQAIQINNTLFISGQIPLDIKLNIISDDISKQTEQVLNNVKLILEKSNFRVENIVKINIFVTDLNKIHEINVTYSKFFNRNHSPFPARTCVEVSKLPKNSQIEIDVIAIK